MDSKPSIDEVWRRIGAHEGEMFHTKTGLSLTYSVDGNSLKTSRTKCHLSIGDFERALALVPLEKYTRLHRLVTGPPYVWAILHDPRIRMSDW